MSAAGSIPVGLLPRSAAASIQSSAERLASRLLGLLLPAYLLDESIAFKSIATPLLLAALAGLLLTSRYGSADRPPVARLGLFVFAAAYLSSVAVSALEHSPPINAAYPIVFAVLAIRRPAAIREFVVGFFAGTMLLVLLGWYRFVTGEGGTPSEHALGYWGIKYTLATRNSDALAPLLGMVGAVFVLSRRTAAGARQRRFIGILALVLCVPALALTYSRSAWLAAAAFLVLAHHGDLRRLVKAALIVAVMGLGLLVAVNAFAPELVQSIADLAALAERLRSIYDPSVDSSNDERRRLLTYAVELGWSHPLAGAGIGQFNCCYGEFGYPDLKAALHPENLFFHLWAENGIACALGLVIAVASAALDRRPAPEASRLARAVLVTMVIWLQFNSELPSLLVWIVLGLAWSSATARR